MSPGLLLVASAGAQEVHRYALLVGTNEGGAERATLRYAHSDAEVMADILETLGGVSADRSLLLLDPSADALRGAFVDLQAEIAADDGRPEVVFYYSGHSDEEGLLLGEDRFGYRELRATLDGLGAKVRLAILDSCASGSLVLSKGGAKVDGFLRETESTLDGVAYITSSSADEVAQEGDRVGGSYFTHYLASGLRGAADTTGDGRVTLDEAFIFARDETLARTERTQHGPQHAVRDFALKGTGDLVLTDLARLAASLALGEAVEGHVVVRSEEGHLVAELEKPLGRPVVLAVPSGSYRVTVLPTDLSQVLQAEVELEQGTTRDLGLDDLSPTDPEAAIARGDAPQSTITSASRAERASARVAILSEDPTDDSLVWGVVTGRSTSLDGIAFGGLAYTVDGYARGAVGAFGYASVGELHGIEATLGVSHAGSGTGLQTAVVANVSGAGFDGVQLGVGVNAAEGGINGIQLAAVNVAPGGVNGWQAGFGLNQAGAASEAVQLAPVNVANDLDGLQLAAVNLGRDVRGVQLGLVNGARDVRGVQLGLVNVAHSVKGTPIGLFSFVETGRHGLLLFASESDLVNVEGRFGGDHLYTLVAAGGQPDRHAYAGYGLGLHATPTSWAWLDGDVLGQAYVPVGAAGTPFNGPPTAAFRARATLGFEVVDGVAPFVGGSVGVRVPPEGLDAQVVPVSPFATTPAEIAVWPGAFAGIQFF